MTDLLSILFPKPRNLAYHCWVERWLKEEGSTDTERFVEAMRLNRKVVPA
jgi:hypothetical protein